MYCSKCGNQLSSGSGFCSNCGMAVQNDNIQPQNSQPNLMDLSENQSNNNNQANLNFQEYQNISPNTNTQYQNISPNTNTQYQNISPNTNTQYQNQSSTNFSNNVNSQPDPNINGDYPINSIDKSGSISKTIGIISIINVFVFQILIIPLAAVGLYFGFKSRKNTNKFNKGLILNLIAILISVPIFMLYSKVLLNDNNNKNNINNNDINNNNNNNNNDNNNNNTSQIKGQFSREIFSGESFDYKTSFDNAVFTFKNDSTFECAYAGGITYKGIFEVYNGLFIDIKADEIAADSSIQNAETLAKNIKDVSNRMMSDQETILNTFLLYLKVNESVENNSTDQVNILQPFLIKYDSSTNTGIAVNIFGQTQGSFILK